MKRMMALVLSLVMVLSLCVSPAWGADTEAQKAANDFVDAYLRNAEGDIYGHVKGFDDSLAKMFDSEGAWNELGDEAKALVNDLLDDAHPGLSYEKLQEWTQGFLFMVEYLVVADGDYEGYIISTDSKGGTLVDPDPPHSTYAVHPFTYEIWQHIVDAEDAFNALSADAKDYLARLMAEPGFGLNNEVKPETLPICTFTDLLKAAKENLADEVERTAQDFVDDYLRNDEGDIFGHVKGYDGSLAKMFDSEGAWNELSDDAKALVNDLLDDAQPGLSYEKLQEWTQGFMFMVEYLVVAEGDYEGYIISTDSKGGTLVDPDPPHNTYAVHPFTHEIWQRIVDAENAFNALSADAKEYLARLMAKPGFGLNNEVKPANLPICNFEELLEAAKKNLEDYEAIGSTLKDVGVDPEGATQLTAEMVEAIDKGATIWIDIEVTENETVSKEKQEQFKEEQKKNGFDGYSINKYLEIEVLMTVEGFYNDPVSVSNTVKEIWIPVGTAKPGFDYAVMREHEGEITLLTAGNKSVVVRGDGKVYVKSDRFSTYALLEKAKTAGGYVGGYTPSVTPAAPSVDSGSLNNAALAVGSAIKDGTAKFTPVNGYTKDQVLQLQKDGKLSLGIEKKSGYASVADKNLAEAAIKSAGGAVNGVEVMYFDITPVLKLDNGTVVAYVTDTEKAITITIELSAELTKAAKDGKQIAVVRVHDGKAEFISSKLNEAKTHVTFSSSDFSTYAVVAMDKVTSAQTFDAGVSAYVATAILSLTGMAWTNKRRK